MVVPVLPQCNYNHTCQNQDTSNSFVKGPDDGFVGIHVNDSVGVFLVQRIAALSVKHNMSSVSVLGGW